MPPTAAMNGPGLQYSGMMSTPTVAPDTHAMVVWTEAQPNGSEPLPIVRGGVWFVESTELPPKATPGQMVPTLKVSKSPMVANPGVIVAAEAATWTKIYNTTYYMASVAATLRGSDVVSLDTGRNHQAIPGGAVVKNNMQPPGAPVFLIGIDQAGANWQLHIGEPAPNPYSSKLLLGYTSTSVRADDAYAMTYFVAPNRILFLLDTN
jgi:hypothetical protein